MKHSISIISLTIILILAACGPKQSLVKPQEDKCMPSWYVNLPHSSSGDTLFAVYYSESARMQIAVNKATMNARNAIAREVETKISQMIKSFEEEVSTKTTPVINAQYENVSKHLTSLSLRGSYVKEQRICRSGKKYRVYVMVVYPFSAIKKGLVEEAKKNQELYSRWRSSQAFRELEEEIQKNKQ